MTPRPAWCVLAAAAALLGCGDAGDVSGADGGGGGGGEDGGGLPGDDFVRYPTDARHSPITPALAARLAAVAAPASRDVFAKVGDSITVSTSFLHCFAGDGSTDLGGRTELEATLGAFRQGDAGGTTPFDRTSAAAAVGWNAGNVIEGAPSPLTSEIGAIAPGFAVVMFGTNDVGFANPAWYGQNLSSVIDQLLAAGVVPLVSSIPPRDDSASADALVPLHDAIALGIAEARQVPFMDLHGALAALPGHGLGGDGVHPEAFGGGACILTAEGLGHGYNTRNLLVLEALDRALRAASGEAPDAAGSGRAALAGDGSAADPYVIDGLPFTHASDTSTSPHRDLGSYDGCAAGADEGGPELYYRLEVTEPVALHLVAVDADGVDVDLHLLRGDPTTAACVVRDDREIARTLEPGTWYVVIDTYVADGAEQAGPYLLTAVADPP